MRRCAECAAPVFIGIADVHRLKKLRREFMDHGTDFAGVPCVHMSVCPYDAQRLHRDGGTGHQGKNCVMVDMGTAVVIP